MSAKLLKSTAVCLLCMIIGISFAFTSRNDLKTTDTVVTYLISPSEGKELKQSDLSEAKSLKVNSPAYRIVSFRITFDRPGASSATEFVNNGSSFQPMVLEFIKKVQVKDLITIADIKAFKSGELVNLQPKIINVVE
jgi:hypothetical protein